MPNKTPLRFEFGVIDWPNFGEGDEMPTKGRGKVLRTRTKKLPGGKFIHIDVVSKPGPQGGRTVAGPVRTKKKVHK